MVDRDPGEAAGTATPEPSRTANAFAHASEAEMARILDFYEVRWEYEPHTFPILWNLDGDVVESFSPDFYLPDVDLYLELTTLKQRLVRKKNRKLRRLRELYPDLRIKLFYARDFRALMLKYGKLALVDALSGTPGQVTPERDPDHATPAPGPPPSAELPSAASASPPPAASPAPGSPTPSRRAVTAAQPRRAAAAGPARRREREGRR